jgi:flagellar basal body-associated protein FliL
MILDIKRKKKEKRIQLLSGLIGICVSAVSLFYFFQAEKAEAEKRMVEIVNYVKVQCSTTPIIMNLRNPKVFSVQLKVPDR